MYKSKNSNKGRYEITVRKENGKVEIYGSSDPKPEDLDFSGWEDEMLEGVDYTATISWEYIPETYDSPAEFNISITDISTCTKRRRDKNI